MTRKSKKDVYMLNNAFKTAAVKAKFISSLDMESQVLAKAIQEGETGEFIDTDLFLKSISL